VHPIELLVILGGAIFIVAAFLPPRPGVSPYQARLSAAASFGLGTWFIVGILARSLQPWLDYTFYAFLSAILALMAWGWIRARAV
jgi:hypothetical protein